jgi:hypothetical protein
MCHGQIILTISDEIRIYTLQRVQTVEIHLVTPSIQAKILNNYQKYHESQCRTKIGSNALTVVVQYCLMSILLTLLLLFFIRWR